MTLSDTFKQSAFDQETDDVWLVLVTISHANISPSIRVVNNTENITSRSNLFTAFPFDITLPDDREDAPPRARLVIDNVSREIAEAVRAITSPPTVLIEIVRADAPDTVETSFPYFSMRNVKWDSGKVSADLTLEDFTNEPYPGLTFTPAYFPGLF